MKIEQRVEFKYKVNNISQLFNTIKSLQFNEIYEKRKITSLYLDTYDFKIFKNIVAEGISILFVEQNVRLALSMADRGYVLESGRLVIDGKSEDLIDNEKVTKVFLGN